MYRVRRPCEATDPSGDAVAADETDLRERLRPGDWQDFAVCKGKFHLFFAPRAERPQARVRREAQARRLCTSCPVQVRCREFARANHEYGFWGGESEEERHLAGFTVAAPIGVRARVARAERERQLDCEHAQALPGAESA